MNTMIEEVLLPKDIFRAYDIRGIYGQTLTPKIVFDIARAFGSEAADYHIKTIAIARDGRLSSPILRDALRDGLLATGCDVIDLGAVPTPLLYYATFVLNVDSGVMLTGSHNPSNHNGLKMVLGGKTLAKEEIEKLYHRIVQQNFITGKGQIEKQDILEQYISEIVSNISLSKPLNVVVDCGNGIGGVVAAKLLRRLGCEVTEQYCEVDGRFPNHHPDPSDPENLECLIRSVKHMNADLGLAIDGDGDRLGVVTNKGEIIWPDRQLMLFAKDMLQNHPGGKIIFDIKCTRHLFDLIRDLGGEPIMWKTGHSLIKAKIAQTNALLAGEMSGHMFFKDRWYGFDDAFYAAARLLEILSKEERDANDVFSDFPNSVNTPELRLSMSEERKFDFMNELIQESQFENGEITTLDGLRVDFENGWGLVRPSNTTPYLIMRFEADDKQSLSSIQNCFREQLLALDENLILPF